VNELIFESLSYIDERHLADARAPGRRWNPVAVAAACLCLTAALSAPAWLWQAGGDSAAAEPESAAGLSGAAEEAEDAEWKESGLRNDASETDNGATRPVEGAAEDHFLYSDGQTPPETGETAEQSETELPIAPRPDDAPDPVYNEAALRLDGTRRLIPGYFEEALGEDELAALLPDDLLSLARVTAATAGFDGEGAPVELRLDLDLAGAEQVRLTLAAGPVPRCYAAADDGEAVSEINGQRFILWRQPGDPLTLAAEGLLQDEVGLLLTLETGADDEPAARAVLEKLLTLLVLEPPALPRRTAEEVPFWQDEELTAAEARADGDFGLLFPSAPPEGFAAESIRRVTDRRQDLLSGLWCRGLAELSWTVRRFAEEDAARLVSPAERERYDLALYPIPRADSVPEALREVVDCPVFEAADLSAALLACRADNHADAGDVDGPRFRFAVRCGELLIEIRSKGVSADWLLAALLGLTAADLP